MKYIAFWEFNPEDMDTVLKKWMDFRAKSEKSPDDYPKSFSDSFSMAGQFKGFQLTEADDPEKLSKMVLHYMPELEFEIVPIFDAAKTAELYQKMK